MSTVNEDDFTAFLNRLAEALGMDSLTPDEDGLIGLTIGDSEPVRFYLDAAHTRILCFTEVCTVPSDAPASVYRKLMGAALFGSETAGGWFSLEPKSDTVIYSYAYPFDPQSADPRAFAEILGCVLDLTRLWRSRIGGMLADAAGLPGIEESDSDEPEETTVPEAFPDDSLMMHP